MTKKILAILLSICCMSTSLLGCAGNQNPADSTEDTKKLSIVTTIFAPYDFARQIIEDKANLTMLLSPGAESHSYEPTPQDIIRIQESDVFIYIGGENDTWVDRILDSFDHSDITIIKLLDCVDAVEEEIKEGMQDAEHSHAHDEDDHDEEEHSDEDVHSDEETKELDEHVWTSPKNAIAISTKFAETFASLDEENRALYEENLASYVSELEELDREFTEIVETASRKTLLFGDRFPLRYFADAYGLDYYAAFSGCSTDTEASAATIAFLTDKVKEEELPIVFSIELSNGNIARSIAEATGAKVETFYACHTLSKSDFEAGMTYVDFMKKNVEVLKEALN